MKKDLCCTTDFMDNLLSPRGHEHGLEANLFDFRPEHIDALMAYCAGIGATRHEWLALGGLSPFYGPNSPLDYDVLHIACEASHRHGMRFDTVLKPFEGGWYGHGTNGKLPLSLPRPEGAACIECIDGLVCGVRSSIVEHPEMQFERDPADLADPGGAVRVIRLINRSDAETGLADATFAIWFSRDGTGRSIETYDGPINVEETVEYRPQLPYHEQSARIVSLTNLRIPADASHIIVRCEKEGAVALENEIHQVVELENDAGASIPAFPAPGPITEAVIGRWRRKAALDPYLSLPEVRSVLDDDAALAAHVEAANRLRTKCLGANPTQIALKSGEEGELVIMRGKPRYVDSVLNPIYPEVREHWLDMVRLCLERDVDGVNIRVQDHNYAFEPWAFGFNPPTMERMEHPDNMAEAAKINGDAYTSFLREAAKLVHDAGKDFGVHVYSTMLGTDERPGVWWMTLIPELQIEWQWETWIREIADYVEFRGAFTLRPESVKRAVDRIGLVARQAGKKFIYQSSRAADVVSFDGPHDHLAWEIENIVRNHPDINIYNLYETACFTRFDEKGEMKGSTAVADLVRKLV
ncbi:MAG: hypothetical protein K9N51_02110 [Candidatus Pacebacteria bacterium]|nr:hypothetical protein [Candidatus Paceibacterota bacterium]